MFIRVRCKVENNSCGISLDAESVIVGRINGAKDARARSRSKKVENNSCGISLDAESVIVGRINGAKDARARSRSKKHLTSDRSVPGQMIEPPWNDKRVRKK